MKYKNDINKQLAELDSEHQKVLRIITLMSWTCSIGLVVGAITAIYTLFNWNWITLGISLSSGGIVIISFIIGLILSFLTSLNISIFLRIINTKCLVKYERQTLEPSIKKALRRNVSLVWLGNYMIQNSYPPKTKVSLTQQEKNEKHWNQETDRLLQETLNEFPDIDSKLKKRIANAIGNTHMHKKDKHILFLSIYSYLNPDAEDTGRVKKILGPWYSQIPQSALQRKLSESLIDATKPTAFIVPTEKAPKKKKVVEQPIAAKPKPVRKPKPDASENIYIDLNDEIEKLFPLEKVAEIVKDQDVDPHLIWAILVSLLQLGKTTSIAGGWNRKEVLIHGSVERKFKVRKWKYPGNKDCSWIIDWLVREKVLNKRTHGRDFGLDFHVTGKGYVGTELSVMLNSAKSHRNIKASH